MANTVIQLKHSTLTGNVPSSLANGEISINSRDGKFFYSTPSGTVITHYPYLGPAGLNKEIQFNDSGTLGSNSGLSFDKTSGSLNVSTSLIVSGRDLGAYANAAFLQANTSSNVANSAALYANGAFNQANSNYTSAVTKLNVTNSGASAYLIDQYSGNNPTIYVRAGETIAFLLNNVVGHPFMIRVSSGGSNYDTGLTHVATDGTITTGSSAQGKISGTLYWKIPYDIVGSNYVYQCSIHSGMVGTVVIDQPTAIAFTQANTPSYVANSAASYANSAFITANAAFAVANSDLYSQATANAAFLQANSAFTVANAAFTSTNGYIAWATANSAATYANGAFDAANAATATDTTQNTNIAAAFLQANTPSATANSAALYANGAFTLANAAFTSSNGTIAWTTANSAASYANSGFSTANSAGLYANASFLAANTPNYTSNSAASYANSAFLAANISSSVANSAFLAANTPSNVANSAALYANGAFVRANNSLNANAGGTVSGDVIITGNLTIQGTSFTANAGILTSNDTMFILGIGNYTADVLDLGFAAHYNAGTNAHSGLIRDSTTKEWYLFKDYTPEIGANNNININDSSFVVDTLNANLKSTSITLKGVDLLGQVNNAYLAANTPSYVANSAASYANSAFGKSNSAFLQANTPSATANSASVYANAAFTRANNSLDANNGGTVTGTITATSFITTGSFGNIQGANTVYANNFVANTGFIQFSDGSKQYTANAGSGTFGTDDWARGQANAAFAQANTAQTTASSAAIYANGAFAKANTGGGSASFGDYFPIATDYGNLTDPSLSAFGELLLVAYDCRIDPITPSGYFLTKDFGFVA
jgi:plastocyanin